MAQLVGTLITPSLSYPGRIAFAERIEALEPLDADQGSPERFILPGFIDLHVHGGDGADCMDGEQAVRRMARFHARHGTTALLATTVTAPLEELEAALRGIAAVVQNPGPGEARVLGVHLEGPFISPERLGAQPPYALEPSIETMRYLLSLAPIRVVTLAPERPGALELIRFLSEQGVRVQQGHTAATYAQALAGFEAGAQGFTHFYNAMTPLHHREPGVVGLGLERARWAEIIPDGLHVHPAVIRALARAIPQTYAVTDAVAAAGRPEGEYRLGRHRVYKKSQGVFLADGTLAGSALTMDRAAYNLRCWGYTVPEVMQMTSSFAAQYLGIPHGLEIGQPADLVVLDEQARLVEVYVRGQKVEVSG
ncbi:N-acetylglucosamine-6-phosphate deacetylase [Meiothermus ruber]|uniref:N-acetylglucosamine-6-phosphate deacetylase n=1 Tax=Meiothermus ruber (strain ATCC 35948 / DSM 1279 / VKM B-1258 / 21) TaxID=504728 RepID=D3PMM3_MEIRD|nr:N-acetylglucosamine-6-phosphate deacetylase [Meiothermus ruber]ADD27198.1 N-acetylglucosamine-6-phosphate deacetylase [Meiothermus ruber DSM 1279]AGK03650.1 N-acetylglucosamine-6-phosphate deacetylase [Meiothermus ruber DSM 1279]MCL6530952.1 N-acetylglucosamine-6-phosphate deacetylase [Meiothermus ruber]